MRRRFYFKAYQAFQALCSQSGASSAWWVSFPCWPKLLADRDELKDKPRRRRWTQVAKSGIMP